MLDSAGYGPVTISQSVSIIAALGAYAGITVPIGQTGVAISAAGINVALRGLAINSTGGDYGVRMTNGSQLVVDTCVISNFDVATGMSIETAAIVTIVGSLFRNNSHSVAAGYGATVSIVNSQLIENINTGITTVGGAPGSVTNVFVSDTLVTGNGPPFQAYCVDNFGAPGATANISATRVTVAGCLAGITSESSASTR